jgi:hypothetical protein
VSYDPEQAREDFEKPFLRARRTLRHLFHISRGDKSFNPNGCDGCKEIHQFLTDPNYRGDANFPVGESIDRDWKLGPDEMERWRGFAQKVTQPAKQA